MFFNTPDNQLRRMYQDAWGREWPHDNAYLHELWLETTENGVSNEDRQQFVLELMRENHEFETVH